MEMAINLSCFSQIPRPTSRPLVRFSSSSSAFFNTTGENRVSLVLGRTRSRTSSSGSGRRRGLSCNCLFGLGMPELVVIAGVAALVFGPKKLPEVGRSIGKTVKSFQEAAKEFESELKKEPESAAEQPVEKAKTVTEEEKQDMKVSSTESL